MGGAGETHVLDVEKTVIEMVYLRVSVTVMDVRTDNLIYNYIPNKIKVLAHDFVVTS